MSKHTRFTTITPLPQGLSRAAVLGFLHNYEAMIDLNPLVIERHPIPPPPAADADEAACVWYQLTDAIAMPWSAKAAAPAANKAKHSNVSYTCVFHPLADGLQTHCRAPLGVDIHSRWTLAGTLPGEARQPQELGLGAPSVGLYLREDVDVRCNMLMAGFVKKTIKKSHGTLVTQLGQLAVTATHSHSPGMYRGVASSSPASSLASSSPTTWLGVSQEPTGSTPVPAPAPLPTPAYIHAPSQEPSRHQYSHSASHLPRQPSPQLLPPSQLPPPPQHRHHASLDSPSTGWDDDDDDASAARRTSLWFRPRQAPTPASRAQPPPLETAMGFSAGRETWRGPNQRDDLSPQDLVYLLQTRSLQPSPRGGRDPEQAPTQEQDRSQLYPQPLRIGRPGPTAAAYTLQQKQHLQYLQQQPPPQERQQHAEYPFMNPYAESDSPVDSTAKTHASVQA